jgi:hypothetical protein
MYELNRKTRWGDLYYDSYMYKLNRKTRWGGLYYDSCMYELNRKTRCGFNIQTHKGVCRASEMNKRAGLSAIAYRHC